MADVTYEDYQDLVRKLSLANERVRDLQERVSGREARITTLEAQLAARTGGMKVKALEWEEIHQRRSDEDPTTEVVGYEAGIPGLWWRIDVEASDFSLVSPEYSYQTFGTLEAAQAAAQADYERRILSALEPSAPEGHQEPVAWMDATGTELHKIIQDYQKRDMIASGGRQAERAPNYSIALFTTPSEQAVTEADLDDVEKLFLAARVEADKAMRKFPQPNYVISKIAEEAGEVVKAAIHCAEGRETSENVVAEIRQAMAMLIRLYIEGDQVHGLPPLKAAMEAEE